MKKRRKNPSSGLTAYRVTTTSGHSWVTNMAKGVTLNDAAKYFLGKHFNVAAYPKEKMEKAIKVEKVSVNPRRKKRR